MNPKKLEKSGYSQNNPFNLLTVLILFFSAFLFSSLLVSAAPPIVTGVSSDMQYAGVGDEITISANATDDTGLRGLYFYPHKSDKTTFIECNGSLNCSATAIKETTEVGRNSFCVRALNANNTPSDLKCIEVDVSLDRPPQIKYFRAQQSEGGVPTISLGGSVKFELVADDDQGVTRVFVQNLQTGEMDERNCSSSKSCFLEYFKVLEEISNVTFCAWAEDVKGKTSAKKCVTVRVTSKESCELIKLDDSRGEKVVGLRLTNKRLYNERDGVSGYSAECCREVGFCKDLIVDSQTCQMNDGNIEEEAYHVIKWNPSNSTIGQLLQDYNYPQIVCTSVFNNYTYIGVVDAQNYQLVSQTQNLAENQMTYWFIGEINGGGLSVKLDGSMGYDPTQAGVSSSELMGRYFFAEQLQKEDNETKITTIIDSQSYSNAMNTLLDNECLNKELESIECQFDCLAAECGAKCGTPCLGCGIGSPKRCQCCAQCHTVSSYIECQYDKYKNIYGRPYADYLYCWKVPVLKDTPWCQQKSDQPTSSLNFPWYGFTRNMTSLYRSLNTVKQEYIDDMTRWNWNAEVNEMPAMSQISKRLWTPETYCNHNFENKLFRNIWTKAFTITPYLNDLRNGLKWTRTGPGTFFAGGGFRREPACWWECCRRCAPFCDCTCRTCERKVCCLSAFFSEGVSNTIELTATNTVVSPHEMRITYDNGGKVATVDNGAVRIVSTGNIPFTVSASFSQAGGGKYIVNLNYNPSSNYQQFVIAQDIALSYDLVEDAPSFSAEIKETFRTGLTVFICGCTPSPETGCPPGCGDGGSCCCCPGGAVHLTSLVSVHDGIEKTVFLDETKIEALREADKNFVDIATGRGINVGLVEFANDVKSTLAPTTDAVLLNSAIDKYDPPSGATCVSCGINRATSMLGSDTGTGKTMIVLTDGIPNVYIGGGCYEGGSSDMCKTDAINHAAAALAAGITVHTVALGNNADRSFMSQLATAGGGRFFDVTCACPLDCVYETLANAVNGTTVLVSDTTGSMSDNLDLNCPGGSMPVVHKFGAVNITVTGRIDNYLDTGITTVARVKGKLNVSAQPDIINRLGVNIGESSMEYLSLIYPVKHKSYRKEYARGYWAPGYPYTIGERVEYDPTAGYREYTFNNSYGYESSFFGYPKQCEQICPSDCTCPDYDIMDVTCTDSGGNKYKRNDCVCLPPAGQSYMTPCTSSRTFHEEEGYYFDFVELETQEVSKDLGIAGELGTNPQFTGDLQGSVEHELGTRKYNTSFIYIANSAENTVSKVGAYECKEICKYHTGTDPSRTAVDMYGNIWVANRMSADLTWINGSNYDCEEKDIIGTIPVGNGPRAISADDNDSIWIGNGLDNNVWRFNAKNGDCMIGDPKINPTCPKNSAPIAIGGDYPYGATYDCFGNVWILSTHNNVLTKIRTSDAVVLGNYAVGGPTYGIASDSNGDIWLGGITSGNVYKVSGATGQLICVNKVGAYTRGIAVDDEDNAWVADSIDNKVIKVDGTNCQLIDKFEVGIAPIGVSLDFDSNIWVVNQFSDDAYKLTDNGTQICIASVGQNPYTYSDMVGYQIWKRCHNKKNTHEITRTMNGTYMVNFEALNFPYPLIKYNDSKWVDAAPKQDCNQICSGLGLFASATCGCNATTNVSGCFLSNNGGVDRCTIDCKAGLSESINSGQCCCSKASFKSEDASMTFFIHFRDNRTAQTFNVFPAGVDNSTYATIIMNVTMRNPSRTFCELTTNKTSEGSDAVVSLKLVDAFTNKPLINETVRIMIESYGLSKDINTTASGTAEFGFKALDQSTNIICEYMGGENYTDSRATTYLNIYSMDRFWWFLSPEVLLLFLVIILLVFSYRWFSGGGMDLQGMLEELRGKK